MRVFLSLAAALSFLLHAQAPGLEQAFRAGQQALQSDNPAEAVIDFKKCLALDPSLVEAKVNLGLAYHQLGDYKSAIHYLSAALRERPDIPNVALIAGMDSMKLGDAAGAIPLLERGLKLDPSNPDAERALATAYEKTDDVVRAAEQFRLIAAANPNKADALYELGHKYLDFAATLAYRGAHLYPDSAWGHRFLGDLLLGRGRAQDAVEEYKKAIAADSHQPGLYAALADALRQAGDAAGAEREAKLEMPKHASAKDALTIGENDLEAGKYVDAERELGQVTGVNPRNAEASYYLARTFTQEAAQAYAELQQSYTDSARAAQLRAEGAMLKGQMDEAVSEYRAALAKNPNDPELHDALGEFYLDSRLYDDAKPELERSLAIDPNRAHALYCMGKLLILERENEQALPYLERAVHADPELTPAQSLLGTAYVRLGRYADAIAPLQKAAPTDHYGSVHYQLSVAYRKLGKPELATKELALSRELHSSYLARDEAVVMGKPIPEGMN